MLSTTLTFVITLLQAGRSVLAQVDEPSKFDVQLNFTNNCASGTDLELNIGGQFHVANLSSVEDDPVNSFAVKTYQDNDPGQIFSRDPALSEGHVRFQFYLDRYWMVREPLDNEFIGVSIAPDREPYDGFCETTHCVSGSCDKTQAHPEQPDVKKRLRQKRADWEPPVYSCPEVPKFTITFCPDREST